MKIDVLEPKAYCAGVSRAIEIAYKARKENPNRDVYVLGYLVHNEHVINALKENDIITLPILTNLKDLISEIKKDSVIIFTAHGHDPKLNSFAKERGLIIYDAACPKVESNLNKIKEEINKGHEVIYIGENTHPETIACLSLSNKVYLLNKQLLKNYYKITDNSPFVINQTTFNIKDIKGLHDDILSHYPNARISEEICSTTRIRQENIINLNPDIDMLLILGSKKSSNTNRLLEIAKNYHPNLNSFLIENIEEIDSLNIKEKRHIAIASGASTPPSLIDELILRIKSL